MPCVSRGARTATQPNTPQHTQNMQLLFQHNPKRLQTFFKIAANVVSTGTGVVAILAQTCNNTTRPFQPQQFHKHYTATPAHNQQQTQQMSQGFGMHTLENTHTQTTRNMQLTSANMFCGRAKINAARNIVVLIRSVVDSAFRTLRLMRPQHTARTHGTHHGRS